METSWDNLYAAEFGKHLSKDDVKAWEESLDYHLNHGVDKGWTATTMRESILSLSERRRKAGRRFDRAPNCADLRSEIIHVRWEKGGGTRVEDAPLEGCALCHRGWLTHGTKWEGIEYTDLQHPCACSAGQAAAGRCKDYAADVPGTMRRAREIVAEGNARPGLAREQP